MGKSPLNLFVFLVALGICTLGYSQSKFERKGDLQAGAFSYLDATKSYLKALEVDKENEDIKLKLARCFYKLNNPELAVRWYHDIINNSDIVQPSDQLNYAMALLSTKNIMEAKRWFKLYNTSEPEDERPSNFLNQIEDIELLYKDSSWHMIQKVSFNSPASDFSPAFYKDGIVFVSSRASARTSYSWDQSAFLDLYYCAKKPLGLFDTPMPFHDMINTSFHEGPVCFYDHDQKMVVTRSNIHLGKLGKSQEGVTKLKLYFTSYDARTGWSELKEFEHNSDEYSLGHPAISHDGKTVYFISDMPGGQGGTDIYVSHLEGEGWSRPESLGKAVNTKGNEMFPYLLDSSKLYFSSNGLGGLGGLDIFEYDLKTKKVKNVGYPINSPRDDFGYIVDGNGEGFFSSNRNSPNQSDDIYKFTSRKPQIVPVKFLVLQSSSNQPVSDTRIKIRQTGQESDERLTSLEDGIVKHNLVLNRSYDITVSKPGYKTVVKKITPMNTSETILIKLQPECITVKGQVKLDSNSNSKEFIHLLLEDTTGYTRDSLGIYNYEQFEFCLDANSVYYLKAKKSDYFTKSTKIITGKNDQLYVGEIVMEKIVVDKAIKLENIYYDVGKWSIRHDATYELDRLASLLEDNPTIEIELSSHTDSRGSDASNLILSEKRAQSVAEYIVSKGIESSRIKYKGYGETNLINQCANGVECSDDQHQANRRTEFKVLSY